MKSSPILIALLAACSSAADRGPADAASEMGPPLADAASEMGPPPGDAASEMGPPPGDPASEKGPPPGDAAMDGSHGDRCVALGDQLAALGACAPDEGCALVAGSTTCDCHELVGPFAVRATDRDAANALAADLMAGDCGQNSCDAVPTEALTTECVEGRCVIRGQEGCFPPPGPPPADAGADAADG